MVHDTEAIITQEAVPPVCTYTCSIQRRQRIARPFSLGGGQPFFAPLNVFLGAAGNCRRRSCMYGEQQREGLLLLGGGTIEGSNELYHAGAIARQ